MKLKGINLAKILPVYRSYFGKEQMHQLCGDIQTRAYHYKVRIHAVPLILVCAMLRRVGSTREILKRWSHELGTGTLSTFSDTLRNTTLARLVKAMAEALPCARYRSLDFVAVDTMPISFANTRRSDLASFNDKTRAAGVLWAFNLHAPPGTNPVQVLHIANGAWNDAKLVLRNAIDLVANGPVYLFDRNFCDFELVRLLLRQQVRFILRARKRNIVVREVIETKGAPRSIGKLQILTDAVVRLSNRQPFHVRLVHAKLPDGEELILISDLMDWTAEQLLESYKHRWSIERMHRLIKDTLGLAHLYSFQSLGIETQVRIAFLIVSLLRISQTVCNGAADIVQAIRMELRHLRKRLGIDNLWKRNLTSRTYQKKKPRLKPQPA